MRQLTALTLLALLIAPSPIIKENEGASRADLASTESQA